MDIKYFFLLLLIPVLTISCKHDIGRIIKPGVSTKYHLTDSMIVVYNMILNTTYKSHYPINQSVEMTVSKNQVIYGKETYTYDGVSRYSNGSKSITLKNDSIHISTVISGGASSSTLQSLGGIKM